MASKKLIVKRVLLSLAALVVLFIGALVAIPYFFRDEIIAAVKNAANDNLNAKFDFDDVNLSLIRSFPNLSVKLKGLDISGIDDFEGVPLLQCASFGMTIDFWSAWNYGKEPLRIKSLDVQKPFLNVLVLADGRANYDIAKPSTDTTSAAFHIELQRYAIEDGHLVYDDRQSGMYTEIEGLNHIGQGDFTQDIFDLQTSTEIAALTVQSGGVSYLKKAKFSLNAGFNVDLPKMKFTLSDNDLRINALQLLAEGWLAMPDSNAYDMELRFSAPQNEFKNLFSLIPNAYTEGYEDVKADGTFHFTGEVKGRYTAEPEAYPTFKIELNVDNGKVKYPDLPMSIDDVNIDMLVSSPTSDLDKMVVDISRFHFQIGANPIDGYFRLRTPISDPDVDTKIKGRLDLASFAKAFPIDGVQTLAGIIDADVLVKTRMSTIDKGDYANVNMTGNATLSKLQYVAEGLPPIAIERAMADFTPQRVNISQFAMKLGKSDLSGTASINNLLAYFSPDAIIKGSIVATSTFFDANEWLTEEEPPAQTPAPMVDEEVPFNRFDFAFDATIERLAYDVYPLTKLSASGRFTPDLLVFTDYKGFIYDSDFGGKGSIENLWNYTFRNEVLRGDLDLRSKFFNLNPFMAETPPTDPAAVQPSEPIVVPAGISLVMHCNVDKVLYDNIELSNVRGDLVIHDQQVRFDKVKGVLLGGNIEMTGGYDTREPEKPLFDLAMKLQQMDFQKTFSAFNTVKAIAPIGKYLQGTFNTELSMKSFLTKDLMPDLNTLDMNAFIQTSTATIKGFAPLEEVANKLNVEEFKNLVIKETKNWFSVDDGTVTIEPFDYTFQDIPLHVSGKHKITGEMDYQILASIPKAKIRKNPVGSAALSGLDYLNQEASKLGLSLADGDFINVEIKLGGSFTQPKTSIKVLGSGGKASLKDAVAQQAKAELKDKVDEAKSAVQAQLEAEKKKAEETAAKAIEEAKQDIAKGVDSTAKKVEETVKKSVEEEAKKKAEEAKKKMEEVNPFKKKKGGGN